MHSFLDISSQIYKIDTKKLPLPGVLCGQWDNYRTNSEDFMMLYLFGIQLISSITHSPVFAGPEK